MSKTAIAIGLVFFLAGLFITVAVWGAYWLDKGIETSGPRAEGHVTGKSKLLSADGDSDFIVEYWFKLPNGERVTTSRGVPKKLWNSLRKGETFVVVYSKENPNRNFPLGGGVTSITVSFFATGIAVIFIVFGVLLVLGAFRASRGVNPDYRG